MKNWKAFDSGWGEHTIQEFDPHGKILATLTGEFDKREKDAFLMAFAPELLEALKRIVPLIDELVNTIGISEKWERALYYAQEAIRKAEGVTK